MKWLVFVLVMLSSPAFCGVENWQEVHVVSLDNHIDIKTNKVTRITGMMGMGSSIGVMFQQMGTSYLPGDRVVIIKSGGGYEIEGRLMIDSILSEKAMGGGRVICVADKLVASMAFNLLSRCDLKLVTRGTKLLAHKMECDMDPGKRNTAKNHREKADECDRIDEPYRSINQQALHMTKEEYDEAADSERLWSAEELIQRHYLDGYATMTNGSSKK